jgi:FkbM family methyltransferase
MAVLRSAAVSIANSIPRRWKRALKWQLMIPDMGASLELMKRKGFSPRHVLDIGAYVGNWTRMCKGIWPEARVCMFEPQEDKRPGLERLVRELPGVELKTTLLGDKPDVRVTFYKAESGSSTYMLKSEPGLKPVELPSTTLAWALEGTPFAKPDLIKVDVQGAELKVLSGGPEVLAAAEVVILETALVEEYAGAPLFAEVIEFMARRGLVVHDICTIWRNTNSESMNEADVIFVRENSPLRDHRFYSR